MSHPDHNKEELPHKKGPLDPNNLPDDYELDEKGCIRHSKYKYVVAGGAAMNLEGNKTSRKNFATKLRKKFGDDSGKLVDELAKIICYDWDKDTYTNDKGKQVRVRFPRVKEADRLAAIKLVLAYRYGQPSQQVNVDENVNIKIDARMHQVAELISRNRDNLKVLPGGKQEDVIDVEHEDIITDEEANG